MSKPVVGVLALQGSFREHCVCLEKAGAQAVEARAHVQPVSRARHAGPDVAGGATALSQVRKPEQLRDVRGLVIPGGESTTMALVAERWGLVRSPPRTRLRLWRCARVALVTPHPRA
jgi:5'-phosphate synthase pdxT subunit